MDERANGTVMDGEQWQTLKALNAKPYRGYPCNSKILKFVSLGSL